jgi:hypothetical protein
MKATFIKPPGGAGVSGPDLIPEYGSEECHSRIKMQKVDAQRDENGRYYAENPFTGKRVYSDESRGHSVSFTLLS